MDQIYEGKAPSDRLPEEVADIYIFSHMSNVLMNYEKLVKTGHSIILDDPIATVVNNLTNKVVMEAKFDHQTST